MLDQICAAASESVGLDDFGDDWFLGPLQAWVADLDQPNLTDFGRRFLRSLAVKDVGRRLRVLNVLKTHPEIASVRIPPIVYITGMERSGTTLLHNLLAEHPQARTANAPVAASRRRRRLLGTEGTADRSAHRGVRFSVPGGTLRDQRS